MAAVAIRRRITRRVVAAQVAVRARIDHRPDGTGDGRARRQHVRTLQREACRAVVKLSIRPEQSVMAGRTEQNRKPCRYVVRHVSAKCRCVVPIFQVAPAVAAIHRREAGGVVVPRVAVRAGYYFARRRQLVRARQRKARRAVIKYCRRPGDRVVASRTVRRRKRRPGSRVHRIVGPVVRCQVAL